MLRDTKSSIVSSDPDVPSFSFSSQRAFTQLCVDPLGRKKLLRLCHLHRFCPTICLPSHKLGLFRTPRGDFCEPVRALMD